jgi:hypothetical protein
MVDDQPGNVTKPPAGSDQIDRQQFFLAADKKTRLESAGGQEGRAPHHRRSGHEPQQGRTRHVGFRRQGTALEFRANGVFFILRADEDAGSRHAETGVRIEQVGRVSQRSRFPPRIIVAQGDVRRFHSPNAEVPRRRPEIASRGMHFHLWEVLGHGSRRAVRGGVVHNHDTRTLRQPDEVIEGGEDFLAPVVGEHHDRHPRVAVRHSIALLSLAPGRITRLPIP